LAADLANRRIEMNEQTKTRLTDVRTVGVPVAGVDGNGLEIAEQG
jgi:hypothetical protein